MAYDSNSSGRFEVYVRPYPNVGSAQFQVSAAGGRAPLWARSGKEMFFVADDGSLMRVSVVTNGAAWNAGTPTKLLDARYITSGGSTGRLYDVSADGERFLMVKAPGSEQSAAPPTVVVVQHWDEELKRLVPEN